MIAYGALSLAIMGAAVFATHEEPQSQSVGNAGDGAGAGPPVKGSELEPLGIYITDLLGRRPWSNRASTKGLRSSAARRFAATNVSDTAALRKLLTSSATAWCTTCAESRGRKSSEFNVALAAAPSLADDAWCCTPRNATNRTEAEW